ncbi:MAG: hypothetical protein IJU23_14440 [Proteobacteria bacterium]|nr:hypothetical protein [Pseudomonadota bacterium]
MRKSVWFAALCAAAVCWNVGCTEDKADVCGGCDDGYSCNTATKICVKDDPCNHMCQEPYYCDTATYSCKLKADPCNNACASNETCNVTTHLCEPNGVDACNNACVAPMKCNQQTGQCVDACNNACVAPYKCDVQTATCKCDEQDTTCQPPCGGICESSGLKCNTATNSCVECLNSNDCSNGQICDNGQCRNNDVPGGCGTCQSGQICNESTGKCIMNRKCGIDHQTCKTNDDCESIVEEYVGKRQCIGGYCIWNACIDKAWDPENEGCGNISGEVYCCGDNCGEECEEPAGNVVLNFSFEDEWEGSEPAFWKTRNDQGSAVVASKSNEAHCGSYAVRLSNTLSNNGNLDSDPIPVAEKDFVNGNIKYSCSMWVKGEGNVNFGYIGLDEDGNIVSEDNKPAKKQATLTGAWQQITGLEVSINDSTSFKVTIGLGLGDVLVDNVVCEQKGTICDNVRCNEWEICSVSSTLKDEFGNFIGKCVPQAGRCNVTEAKPEQGTCSADQICDTESHTCKRVDGKCLSNKDCKDDSKPVCDSSNNCVAGDPCAKVDCKVDWRECTVASRGTCVVKPGRCLNSSDCTKDAPACYGATHTCVAPDFATKVSKQKECKTVDKEYFNYFNYVDEDPKGQMKFDSLMCPINIIPNGSFEDWIEFKLTQTSQPHVIPDWWYAKDDYNNFTVAAYKYMTQLSFDAIKVYQKSTYHGDSAMQLIYTGQGGKNRLTSFGFPVPGGTWDCSYWVRGSGDVKIHSYSSRGDAKETDYVKYDTNEWTRATFKLKESASDARLVIYVSNTKDDKEHIQIDNIVCTAKGSTVK